MSAKCITVAAVVLTVLGAAPAAAQDAFTPTQAAAQDQYGNPGNGNPGGGGNNGGGQGNRPDEPPGREQSRPGADGDRRPASDRGPASGAGPEVAGNRLPTQRSQGAGLPFTGFDLPMLVGLGVLALALGLALAAAARWNRQRGARP